MRFFKFALLNGAALGLGALIATACITVDYPEVAFRCNPRLEDACPEGYLCCSDDPSQFFSGQQANHLSARGMCVEDGAIQTFDPEKAAPGCPIPCNPKWSGSTIANTCGQGFQCCQTVALTDNDCVLDPDTGRYRPVEIEDTNLGLTAWRRSEHDTHQDPGGDKCLELAAGDTGSQIYEDCISTLTVADERGFCRLRCPLADPTHISACEALNQGGQPPSDGSTGGTGTGTGV